MTSHCSPTMEGRRRALEVRGGGTGQKEERALMARLLSPSVSRRRCSTQGLGRKEKDGKRRERKKERMWWRRGGRWFAVSGGLTRVLTEQERADKGQKGHC